MRLVEGVVSNEGRIVLEGGISVQPPALSAFAAAMLQRMIGAKPVADVGVADLEVGVVFDEGLVDPPGLNDVVGDVVQDDQIGLRREHGGDVGEIEAAMLEHREHRDLHVTGAEPPVGEPGPEDRVHLRHVGAPEHEGVGRLEIIVAAHGLVDAERCA